MTIPASGSFRNFPMGAARSSFASSVRKKVDVMRALLSNGIAKREELRRNLHALGNGARSLNIEPLAQAISEILGRLDRLSSSAPLPERDQELLEQGLQALVALAWGQVERCEKTVAVLGEPCNDPRFARDYAVTQTGSAKALLASAMTMDLVILDADAEGALEAATALVDDADTENVPAIIVGAFRDAKSSGAYIALGFQHILSRPISYGQLELVIAEATRERSTETLWSEDFGSISVKDLAARLAAQLEVELAGAGATDDANIPVALGRGVEVQAALWGAVARIREVLTSRSRGAVAFKANGPLGTTHLAPSLELDRVKNSRRGEVTRGASSDVSLKGRRILVVDDDPGVTWFLADLLRSQGCLVDEALDGESALLRAYAQVPDLVISDILMPKMDGLQLCRALRRDPVLEHTPVILLSWKEDLMQRVRELRYEPSGFLRKESDVRAIVARIQEALFPRARIEARLHAGDSVRGRLDGFTPSTLIDVVARSRPDTNLMIREGAFMYEMCIRNGAPVSVVRTNGRGEVLRGGDALALLLGVSSGRFTVEDCADAAPADLDSSYRDLAMNLVAEARATSRALWSERMLGVGSIEWNQSRFAECMTSLPGDALKVASMLQRGDTPRQIMELGSVESRTLESVLLFAARRGVVASVSSDAGEELSVRIELPARMDGEVRIEPAQAKEQEDARSEAETPVAPSHALARPDATDVQSTEYGPLDAVDLKDISLDAFRERSSTNIDHTLYGGRLLDLPAACVLTPRGPVALLALTPSPAFLDQADVAAVPPSLPSVPVSVEASEGLLEQAMLSAQAPRTAVKGPFRRWAPALVFTSSILIGAGIMRSITSAQPINANVVSETALPTGVELKTNEGALQIEHDGPSVVQVDGADKPQSTNATLVLPVGSHTLSTKGVTRTVDVKPLRLTKVRLRSNP
jgi:DNA-binding response OmpR family regulator